MSKYRSETETPPNSKLAINVTIERSLIEEMKRIHDLEIKLAKDEDRSIPDWSNTCEMICRKGVKAYRRENPHVAPQDRRIKLYPNQPKRRC